MVGLVGTRRACATCVFASMTALPAAAQPAPLPDTREGRIAAQQAEKAARLQPYKPNRAEAIMARIEEQFVLGTLRWHPFFDSAYQGGGFTLGAGYFKHLSPYNSLDVRGSLTVLGYKRVEAEFLAPRLFENRGVVSVLGGWREATEVAFFGIGTANTSMDDEVSYSFRRPYLSARLDTRPTRRYLTLGGGVELTTWEQRPGGGSVPSVETVYTPETLPGLGASPTYLHVEGTAGLDWRPAVDYAHRGGAYSVTLHSYADQGGPYSFRLVEYDVVQHLPILRDAWALSFHGRVQTTHTSDGDEVPFFMMPALGSGSTLRGFRSWRFRDRNSLLLSVEWRVLASPFIDTALFYDAGKVTASPADLDFDGLKSDFGIGFRIHGPSTTPIRVDVARSNEITRVAIRWTAAF